MPGKSGVKRIEEFLTDTYDYEEAIEGLRIYLEENLKFPFQAKLRGARNSAEFTVTAMDSNSLGHCIACKAKLNGNPMKIPASELAPVKSRHNAKVISDYLAWLKN